MSVTATRCSVQPEPGMLVYAKMLRAMSEVENEPSLGAIFSLFMRQQLGAEGLVVIARDRPNSGEYRVLWADLAATGSHTAATAPAVEVPGEGTHLATLLSELSPCVRRNWRLPAHDPLNRWLSRFHSLMSVPAFDHGVMLGIVVLFHSAADAFSEEHVPEVMCLVNLLSRTIQAHARGRQLKHAFLDVDRELRSVGTVQRTMLPARIPVFEGGSLAVGYRPSRHASGDYYSFFALPEGEIGILLADACGHGPAAAVPAAVIHALAHVPSAPVDSPSRFLAFLNSSFADVELSGAFVTAIYAIYSPRTLTLRYAVAGHPLPRIVSAQHEVWAAPAAHGLPLGIRRSEEFGEACVTLKPGERSVLYTDGITDADAQGAEGEPIEVEGLDQLLCEHGEDTPQQLVDAVLSYLGPANYANSLGANLDDRTILVLGADR